MVIGLLVILAVVGIVIFGSERDMVQRYRAASGGVVNHDGAMRSFFYHVPLSEEEIRQLLLRDRRYTTVKYRYDDAQRIITLFSELPDGSPDTSYRLTFAERKDGILLKVTQIDRMWEKQRFSLLMNEFWKQKLDAKPVAYDIFL